MSLYERTSITPQQLIAALQECETRWPMARLHKNDVTKNLTIKVDGEAVGMIDLLRANIELFDNPFVGGFIAAATDAGE